MNGILPYKDSRDDSSVMAMRYEGSFSLDILAGTNNAVGAGPKDEPGCAIYFGRGKDAPYIPVPIGHWVIRDGNGNAVCDPDTFAAIYTAELPVDRGPRDF